MHSVVYHSVCMHVDSMIEPLTRHSPNFVNLIASLCHIFMTQNWVQHCQKNMLKVVVYVYLLKFNVTYQQ